MKNFVLGKDKSTGKIKTVQEVNSGLACNCVCPHCNEDLVAAQGKKTDWYFRHHQQTDCKLGPEAGALALAEEIFLRNHKISLPNHGSLEYSGVAIAQKPKGIAHLPAFTLQTPQGKVHVNLSFEEALNEEEMDLYRTNKALALEIDLAEYEFKNRQQFKRDLLENIRNKKMIFWPEAAQHPVRKETNRAMQSVLALIGAGVFLGALSLLRPDKPKQKRISGGW